MCFIVIRWWVLSCICDVEGIAKILYWAQPSFPSVKCLWAQGLPSAFTEYYPSRCSPSDVSIAPTIYFFSRSPLPAVPGSSLTQSPSLWLPCKPGAHARPGLSGLWWSCSLTSVFELHSASSSESATRWVPHSQQFFSHPSISNSSFMPLFPLPPAIHCVSPMRKQLSLHHRVDIEETLLSFKTIAYRPLRWKCKSFLCSLAYALSQRLMLFSVWGSAHRVPVPLLFDFRKDEPVLSGSSQLREIFFRCAGHCCLCLGGLTAMSHAGHAGWNSRSVLGNVLFPRFPTPETQT